MIAVLGGMGAAAMWAVATVASARASRQIGAASTLAWVMAAGLVVALPLAVASGGPGRLDAGSGGWLLLAGLGNVLGLLLEYAAFRVGKIGVVAPIASGEGAVAAVIALLAGEALGLGQVALLGLIVAGVAMAAAVPDAGPSDGSPSTRRVVVLAVGAAVSFGVSLYAAGRASLDLPAGWVPLPARIVGVAAVTLPLALSGRLRLARRALPLVALAGAAEVGGFLLFAVAARHGIAVSAVLGSQFAALAAVGAFVLFRERLARIQVAGAVTIVLGVAALSGLRA